MADDDALPDPARVVIRRRIEWIDTDAAGIWHWTVTFRLVEAAEAVMHTALGIASTTFGACPRASVTASFSKVLHFNDPVDVELAVESIGRTSLVYRLAIASDGEPAAEGSLTVVFIDQSTGRAAPWPPAIREQLAGGGLVVE
jgi:acyl-CoA thioester hydrolase